MVLVDTVDIFESPRSATTMISAASRRAIGFVAKRQCRSFSSTPAVGTGAEVKKLGVIGAGQMVLKKCIRNTHKTNIFRASVLRS